MKRLIYLVIAIMMLGSNVGYADSHDHAHSEEPLMSICFDGVSTVYYARKNILYQYPAQRIIAIDHTIYDIRADNNYVYILGGEGKCGQILIYDIDAKDIIKSISCGYVSDFDIIYPNIFLCEHQPDQDWYVLVSKNVNDNSSFIYEEIVDPVSVCVVGDSVVTVSFNAPHGYLIIGELGINNDDYNIIAEMPPYGLIRNSNMESNSYLINSGESLYSVIPTANSLVYEPLNVKIHANSAWCTDTSNIYVAAHGKIEIIKKDIAFGTDNAVKNLVIAGNTYSSDTYYISKAAKRYAQRYSETTISVQAYATDTDLYNSLADPESCPDIVILSNFNYHRFGSTYMLENLLEFPSIKEMSTSGEYSSWLFNFVDKDINQCILLPYGCYLPSFIRLERSEAFPIAYSTSDDNMTWVDLLSSIEAANSHAHLPVDYLFLSSAINHYYQKETHSIDFDHPEFRLLCERWKSHINYTEAACSGQDACTGVKLDIYTATLVEYCSTDETLIVPPQITKESRSIGAELLLIGIPRNSSMKNEAAEFINNYYAYLNSEDYTSAYENLITSEQKISIFRALDLGETEQKEVQYYQLLSESEPRDVAPRLEFALHKALDLYMNGKYTINELIGEMNRVSNDYFQENYN